MSETALTHSSEPSDNPAPVSPEGGPSGPVPAAKPAATRNILPVFCTRHWILYGLGVVLIVAAMGLGFRYFRSALDAHQVNEPRYAAERAIKALEQGNKELAAQEIKTLMDDVPIRTGGGFFNPSVNDVWEGRVLRNRVQVLERLTGKLLAAGMPELAESVGWKMMLEFHIASRVLEHIDLWEWMFYIKAMNKDWTSAFEILKILTAHGVGMTNTPLRTPDKIDPYPAAVDPALLADVKAFFPPELLTRLNSLYLAENVTDYIAAANILTYLREKIKNPAVVRKVNAIIHRCLLKGNHVPEAHKFFGQVSGRDLRTMDSFWQELPNRADPAILLDRDPALLGMMWRDRPRSTTTTLSAFLDSFRTGDPRVRIVDFSKLRVRDVGYFNPENKIFQAEDRAIMSQAAAASMPVQVTGTVHRVFIAFESTPALGLYPILLVRVGDRPYIPLYCDSEKPDLVYFDITLEGPATYPFEFVYLNDAAFKYTPKKVDENRDLQLIRMALVQTTPEKK